IVSMPYFLASRGLEICASSPLTKIWPASRLYAPDRILMRVDLPAPLWPSSATTSPGWRSTEASSTARMPPKAIEMFRMSTSGVPVRSTRAFVSATIVPPLDAFPVHGVEPHRDHQHGAHDDALQRRID